MAGELSLLASSLGMNIWLFVIILIWELVWKVLAMWKAARNNSPVWFICLLIFNTIGILPILYIYVFSKLKKSLNIKKSKKSKK